MKFPLSYKKLFQYFLQGLLILAPIVITFWAIAAVFSFIDGILPNIIHNIFPSLMEDAQGNVRRVPGLGFVVVIAIVLFVGYISSSFIFSKLVDVFDKLLEKTPGIKFIYSTLKDFFEAFAGEKKKFTNNVLANVDDNDVWRVGFITQEDMAEFGFKDYIAVYVPMAYSVAGNVYIISKERVKPITNISAAQTMKFAVSGGVTDVVEE
ncbi:DUF502 domain-containing protein [Ferruginibacter lapsinanis]|uniref:DUF502 domain-containing protein n=1 Tax=Ferruginibacter lapsinanis TaxID=563172 RepID=UPI001E2DAE0D|nr:DUF502 domain-containing protein [Ferruginibacter lapsinanis]UEG51056.1 DUF502 domain-containing protein [Ferruginibacter lapsinanis]